MEANEIILIAGDHSKEDLIKAVKELSEKGRNNDFVKKTSKAALRYLDPKQQDNYIYRQVYKLALYEASPLDRQKLQTVNQIQRTKKTNCVGYSIIISSILQNLNRSHVLRLVDVSGKGFDHIYIKTPYSTLDCVLGQNQDGTDTWQNRKPNGKFDNETSYQQKIDYPMLTLVNGTSRIKSSRLRTIPERFKVNGLFDDILKPLLGDECNFQCNIKHASDEPARLECKEACALGMTPTQYQMWKEGGGTTIGLPSFSVPQQQRDNTLLYVGIGVAAVYFLTKGKKR